MTAALRLQPQLAGEDCARCHGPMVITQDAVGRDRKRCPKCDGISRNRVHPDEVLMPQGLVRKMGGGTLPTVAPGQLRCQRCAHGVEGDRRFCEACQRAHRSEARRGATYAPKPCATCGATFQPTGPRARYCEACR